MRLSFALKRYFDLALINRLPHLAIGIEINLTTKFFEFFGHVFHAFFGFDGIEGLFFIIAEAVRIIAHVLGNFHGAEFRAAHRAEMGDFMRVFRQGLVVEILGRFRVEGKVKLIFPAKVKPCAGERIIADLGVYMLALAGGLLLASGVMLRKQMRAD